MALDSQIVIYVSSKSICLESSQFQGEKCKKICDFNILKLMKCLLKHLKVLRIQHKDFRVLFDCKIVKYFTVNMQSRNDNQEEGEDIVRMPKLNGSTELQFDER